MRVSKLISIAFIFFFGTSSSYCQLTGLVSKNEKAVFSILVYGLDGNLKATATGFFIDSKGTCVTNYHVLDSAYRAEIKLSNGTKYDINKIISYNHDADLVKFSINNPNKNLFNYLTLSYLLPQKGQKIFVIGNPEGLESTVSEGIVSSVRQIEGFGKIIQITAPISHGSSGSPIMTMDGKVIAVVSFSFIDGQNLNFGIASQKINELGNQMEPIKIKFDGPSYEWGDKLKGKVKFVYESIYNAEIQYRYDGPIIQNPPPINNVFKFTYDNKGNVIKAYQYRSDREFNYSNDSLMDSATFKYDEYNFVECKSGNVTVKFEYNSIMNIIEEEFYDGNSESIGIFKFDNGGNIIEHDNYDKKGQISLKQSFDYNDNGDITVSDVSFGAETITKYEYKYDANGNWISRISFDKNGKQTQRIMREIKYY